MKQITCPHCADTYPDFDVAHVCSKGPYAPKLKSKMNERIKELAEQAGIVFWEISGDVDWRQADKETLAKFAELIVQECAKVCDDLDIDDWGDKSFDDGTYYCSRAIKQHFGVEE